MHQICCRGSVTTISWLHFMSRMYTHALKLCNVIKIKHKAWNGTGRHEDFISYTKYRNIATAAVKYTKQSFETNLAKDIQQNPTLFWKYVRNNTKVRHDVDKLVKEDGTLTSSDCEVANCLNDFFTSVFTNELASDVPTLPDRSNGSILQDIKITHQDILYQLGQLKTNKSCGSDNCHPLVLKNVKEGLVVPLYYLYLQIFRRGKSTVKLEGSYNNSSF